MVPSYRHLLKNLSASLRFMQITLYFILSPSTLLPLLHFLILYPFAYFGNNFDRFYLYTLIYCVRASTSTFNITKKEIFSWAFLCWIGKSRNCDEMDKLCPESVSVKPFLSHDVNVSCEKGHPFQCKYTKWIVNSNQVKKNESRHNSPRHSWILAF